MVDLPKIITEQWVYQIERELNIHDQANDCDFWLNDTSHYVYAYKDITQLDQLLVYVGIGSGHRARSHWTKSHNKILNLYVDHWKAQNLSVDDVLQIICCDIKQRHAAAIETYLIENLKPECNFVRYWMPDGTQEISEDRLMKWRVESNPVLAKNLDGELRLFTSARSAGLALGILRNSILEKIGKIPKGPERLQHTFRYLTEAEIDANIHLWPAYYEIQLNGKNFKCLNLEKFSSQQNLPYSEIKIGTVNPEITTTVEGSLFRCKFVQKHESEEIHGFKVKDDLPRPKRGNGYQFIKSKGSYRVQIRIDGNNNYIGTTKNEKIAQLVADFVYENDTNADVIVQAKTYLSNLRREIEGQSSRRPALYFSQPENILTELIEIQPKSLSDWQHRSSTSYTWAWRLGKQRELFAAYLEEQRN